jgi:hypothetical protein
MSSALVDNEAAVSKASIIVIAKAPSPGRVKTRLCPPLTSEQAAGLAEAALCDTLHTVMRTRASAHLLALDGDPGRWLPPGIQILSQRGRGLGERIARAFQDAGGPALLIGMDTPQITTALLALSLDKLEESSTDAVLGPTADGGYWSIGLKKPDARAFLGVPMSSPSTGAAQWCRLKGLGLRVSLLPEARDVDLIEDAIAVARMAPMSLFASALAKTGHTPRVPV